MFQLPRDLAASLLEACGGDFENAAKMYIGDKEEMKMTEIKEAIDKLQVKPMYPTLALNDGI